MSTQNDFVKLVQEAVKQEFTLVKDDTKRQVEAALTPALSQLRGYAALGQKMEAISQNLGRQVEDLRRATIEATKAKTENEQLLAQVEAATNEANKALDLLRLAGEVEQQQYVAKLRLTNEEAAYRDNMKNRLAEMEADFDLRRQALQGGRGQYFPELDKELKRLMKDLKANKDAEPEIKAVPAKEDRLPKAALKKNTPEPTSLPDLD